MLTIGDKLPEFNLKAVVSNDLSDAFIDVKNDTYKDKWLVLFAWPKDFTFVCPTEISDFGRLNGEFADRDAQVLGMSTDSEFVHLAWRKDHPDLNNLPFPMLADIKRELSDALGILIYFKRASLKTDALFSCQKPRITFILVAIVTINFQRRKTHGCADQNRRISGH